MAKFTQKTDCSYCGTKDSIIVITSQTKWSRSIKVMKCKNCDKQNGIKETINKATL